MNASLAGRYRMGGLLGAGGSAEVYAAHDELADRPVAVKLARRPGDRTIAVQARATARLDHPRIVRVLDTGELDGRTGPGRLVGDQAAGHLPRVEECLGA